MSFEGGTYTIVVDKDRNIVSVTLNGKPLVDKDAQIRAAEQATTDAPAPFNPTEYDASSRCICLGEITPPPPDAACVWKWGKLF
jgi:hypothetical protein